MGWRRFWRRDARDEELARELESYLAHEADSKIADGSSPRAAREAAMRKLGNTTRVREQVYESGSLGILESVAKDLRYAARLLRRSPGFAVAAILSLALGIGANTAIFQLLDAVRLRSLPVARPAELLEVTMAGGRNGFGVTDSLLAEMTAPLWDAARRHQQAFSAFFAWGPTEVRIGRGAEQRVVAGMWASGDTFPALGVVPYRGRLLGPADDRRGCAPGGVVISYAFWQREFGGSDAAIGRDLVIGDRTFQVVGVTPPEFFGLEVGREFSVAVPLCAVALWGDALDQRNYFWLIVMGRLKPGWSVAQAAEHMGALSPGLMDETLPPGYSPESTKRWRAFRLTAVPAGHGVSQWREAYETSLWLLLGITGLVLLIACANLASLMLARATSRAREFAVRLAIGASRGRLMAQSLAESALVASTGAALGVVLSKVLSGTVVSFLGTGDDGLRLDLAVDWPVLAFVAGVAMLTCVLCGIAPALRSARTEPAEVMKSGGRGHLGAADRSPLQRLLVIGQIAISLVLIVSAGLFVRSFRNLITLDAGFRQDGILYTVCDLSKRQLKPEQVGPAKAAVLDRLRAIAQVERVVTTSNIPLSGASWTMGVRIAGVEEGRGDWTKLTWVSPGYFATMDIPMRSGRDFTSADTADSHHVLLVNQTFVRRYLAGRQPIGTLLQTVEEPGYPAVTYEIVGVVSDTKYANLRDEIPPISYAPAEQNPRLGPWMGIVLRASAAPDAITRAVQRVFDQENAMSPGLTVLRDQVRAGLVRERLMSWLAGFFGVLAALLAAIGLYGVMSYSVAKRSSEIAIRMALGAARGDVLRLMIGQASRMLVVGLALGTVAALAAGRAARTLLFGLDPWDPATLAASAVLLASVALAAAWVPAARATRVSPLDGLRAE